MYKHGLSKNPIYDVWHNMKNRCLNPKNKRYDDYGGRGIAICDEWMDDLIVFVDWCNNNGYEQGLDLDRIDNDGNYEPKNCRFVTHQINQCNQRLLQSSNTSGYRGVSWNKGDKKWRARIRVNGVHKLLGSFSSPKLAALRYNAEAYVLGDGRPMNIIDN